MNKTASTRWIASNTLLNQLDSNQWVMTIKLCDTLLENSLTCHSLEEYLQKQLPEISTELAAQWIGVVKKSPDWEILGEFGRSPFDSIPKHFLSEALDQEAAGISIIENATGWKQMAIPVHSPTLPGIVLLLAGKHFTPEILTEAMIIGKIFGIAYGHVHEGDQKLERINRLKTTLDIARQLAGITETEPLLELIAKESTRLLDCDRASIFIWDKEHKQVVACPALGMKGGTLRLPDNKGIVGDVIQSGKPARVDDTYEDSRFDNNVDSSSGYKTENLLCWPLFDSKDKLIGAFEVINKNKGVFTKEDEEVISHLGLQVAIAIQNTQQQEQLIRSQESLTEQVTQGVHIIGSSSAIQALRSTIERLSSTELPVLILGESGTGKEVVSQSLHYLGSRAKFPFVAVNCAAIAETLLESELFGHEKGAFTDAHDQRKGKFELAEGGTIFLDEIGDMSLGGQAKLLRVLEQKVITRVGGSETIPINVRIIAATNANLTEKVRDKKFREDLYYRLSVVTQMLPPLRDRPEDILLLAEHFLAQFCTQARRVPLKLSAEARRRLQSHSWPGNVRELRNLMERVAFLCQGNRVESEDLAFILSPDQGSLIEPANDMPLEKATKEFQRGFIRQSIKRMQGNMSEAAKLIGVHRSNLYRKMRQLDMNEAGDED
jgi:transcriptional regulator with GAF, ATPase, and Fis domain